MGETDLPSLCKHLEEGLHVSNLTLAYAAQKGNVKVLDMLMNKEIYKNGAYIPQFDWRSLAYAARGGSMETLKYIGEAGAPQSPSDIIIFLRSNGYLILI